MRIDAPEMLRRLGSGESIQSVCRAAGMTRGEFDAWWRQECAVRVPALDGKLSPAARLPGGGRLEIVRDRCGIPHVSADNDADLFFGFGLAMAQDRLFQLDYLRRKGAGRLAEILGPEALESDLLVRTVGLRRIAEVEWTRLGTETQALLTAFAAGVNAAIAQAADNLPIEFALLDYRPEPWTPLDSLTVEGEFRWYLTGRFPVIVMPELAKRGLGDGPLYQAFLQRESDEESVIPPGSYPTTRRGTQPVGTAGGDPQSAQGSNNWVVAGARAASGRPLVASDPHIAFEAVSCWYEVHLCGGSFNVAGMAYAGIPAVMFGRNERVAWGCTNNICSLRDLYQERTAPAHPGCYEFDGRWIPERRLEETIRVRGGTSVVKTIRFSHNGPIVDDVLPPPARTTGPVALRWLGAHEGGWLTALLAMDRAADAAALREAMRPWHVPTFCVVYADVAGRIGVQATGRIPVRNVWERGYRPGWDPRHQWDGVIPFDAMPHAADPDRGWFVTANARPAPEDFPYPLSGTWSDDLRSQRIRDLILATPKLTRDDFAAMHQDTLSLRALRCAPPLAACLQTSDDKRLREAAGHLAAWDHRLELDRVGATLFDVFFAHWILAVARERFQGETAALLSGGVNGLSAALLEGDAAGWFGGRREQAIREAMSAAVDFLANRLGPDMAAWTWGRLHTIPLRHVLTARGDLGQLLDHGGAPVKGGLTTVCNTSPGPDWAAKIGAGYRLIADLATSPPALHAIDAGSQSGHPGSPHYHDQLPDWLAGRYHTLPLAMADVEAETRLTVE